MKRSRLLRIVAVLAVAVGTLVSIDSGDPAAASGNDPFAIFRDGRVFIRNTLSNGPADADFWYGDKGDIPVFGDWNGDGVDTIGIFRDGMWFLRNSNTTGTANLTFWFGDTGDLPVAGDWNGDGIDTIGVYRDGHIFLRDSNSTGAANYDYWFGATNDIPVAGDFNNDGKDSIGVFRNGQFFLRYWRSNGASNATFWFGAAGDAPVAGDWNGNGQDTIGVYRDGNVLLRNSNSGGGVNINFWFGQTGDWPAQGSWLVPEPAPTTTTAPAGNYYHPVHGWITLEKVGPYTVNASIATNLRNMLDAAGSAGYQFGGWAWRSYERQIELRKKNCGTTYYAIYQMPSNQCSPHTARPGSSRHELGLAIDFATATGGSIAGTGHFNWLAANAASYGLYNYAPEPWHWSDNGN